MKLGCNNESDWCRTLAIALAHSSDATQAEFFSAFSKECLSWGFLKAETQLASVNTKLSNENKELLAMLGFKE